MIEALERRGVAADRSGDDVVSVIRQFFSGLRGTIKSRVQLGRAMISSAMIAVDDAESIFRRIFKGITLDTLKIPFAAVAVDLVDGAPVTFSAGKTGGAKGLVRAVPGADGLMRAVMASSAIPLVFPAVEVGGHATATSWPTCLFGKPERWFPARMPC